MAIEKLPLHERLGRLDDGLEAHEGYDRWVVRSMARLPISDYLGDYNTFCDFQSITEVKEDLSYQLTAKVIADRVWAPADWTQIINILAAPVIQIENAYRQGKSSLLPRKEIRKNIAEQESLTYRLARAGVLAGPPYNCHSLPIGRFFYAVVNFIGERDILTAYDSIKPHIPSERTLFREAVYTINELQSPERVNLLYAILVKPFTALPEFPPLSLYL